MNFHYTVYYKYWLCKWFDKNQIRVHQVPSLWCIKESKRCVKYGCWHELNTYYTINTKCSSHWLLQMKIFMIPTRSLPQNNATTRIYTNTCKISILNSTDKFLYFVHWIANNTNVYNIKISKQVKLNPYYLLLWNPTVKTRKKKYITQSEHNFC
jgi:hypothetical protein